MRRWLRDLALGSRLVVFGGPTAWLRLAMTAIGVGVGVALLLLATAAPTLLAGHRHRMDARDFAYTDGPATAHTVQIHQVPRYFRGESLYGVLVRPDGADPVVPPGLSRLPGPGEMVVSPALRQLLAGPDGAELRSRYRARVVGTIGPAGLAGPREYAFYLGSDRVAVGNNNVLRISRFGTPDPIGQRDPTLLLLTVVGITVLLVPVAVFVAAAVRFGSAARDRQQAALRLVGADRAMTRRIAAAEALLGAVGGLLVGAVLFAVGRQLVELVSIDGISIYGFDIRPDPALAALIVLALPVAAVAVTLVTLRRVVAEPLGVVRRGLGRGRRMWWRLVAPVLGLVTLGLSRRGDDGFRLPLVVVGVLLLLVGAAVLLPWLVEAAVRRLRGGGVSRQLAVRRLQLDSGTAARAVAGITVAVAGAIALQTLIAGVQHSYVHRTGQDPSKAQVWLTGTAPMTAAQRAGLIAKLRRTDGVQQVRAYGSERVSAASDRRLSWDVVVADCDTLRALAAMDHCTDGDVFAAGSSESRAPRAGERLQQYDGVGNTPRPALRLPMRLRTVQARTDPVGLQHAGALLTPAAARRMPGLAPRLPTAAFLRTDPANRDAFDHVVTTASRVDPTVGLIPVSLTSTDAKFASIRHALLIGAAAVLAGIGMILLSTVLEQLRSRRGPLAVLSAFGTRRRTLTLSVLWQTAIPMFLGLLLAIVTGLVLGGMLLRLTRQTIWFDLTGIVVTCLATVGVVAVVTLLSIPVLVRMMRPEAMHTE